MHGREHATEDTANPELPTAGGRYGAFRIEGGDLVIFDRRAPDTWIQSGTVVDVSP
jgi:hypothetical protein